jgi:hypothetical protein
MASGIYNGIKCILYHLFFLPAPSITQVREMILPNRTGKNLHVIEKRHT